jgi:hypothetical protein
VVPKQTEDYSAGATRSFGFVDGLSFSRAAWNITYSGGIAKIPTNDARIIPPNTGVPTPCRANSEAPFATTSG